MADTFGATFAPFPDPSGQNKAVTPIQQAIQMLSLRVPRVVGAAAPASAALLNSPGSGGSPDVHSAVLQTVLKTLMGNGTPMSGQPPLSPLGPMSGAPTGPSGPLNPFGPASRDGMPMPPEIPGAPHVSYEEGPGKGGAPHVADPGAPAAAPPAIDTPVDAAPDSAIPAPPDQRESRVPDGLGLRRGRGGL